VRCVYLDQGIPAGQRLGESTEQHLVLRGALEPLSRYHRAGMNLAPCLEYSVRLGKHKVTEHLVNLQVPVTRTALENAAQRRGPGVDLLLAHLEGDDLAQASSAAASFRIRAGDSDKAYRMLETGTRPDRYFILAAYIGILHRPPSKLSDFHEALDQVLARISKESLKASSLDLLVEFGRPIHIERALEILQRPLAALLPHVMGLPGGGPLQALRDFQVPMDDAAFAICTQEMTLDCQTNFDLYLQRLCDCTLMDGDRGEISAQSMAPVLTVMLTQRFSHFPTDLRRLIPCLKGDPREALRPLIDTMDLHESTRRLAREAIDLVASEFDQPSAHPTP
jgi:hypothetical protein